MHHGNRRLYTNWNLFAWLTLRPSSCVRRAYTHTACVRDTVASIPVNSEPKALWMRQKYWEEYLYLYILYLYLFIFKSLHFKLLASMSANLLGLSFNYTAGCRRLPKFPPLNPGLGLEEYDSLQRGSFSRSKFANALYNSSWGLSRRQPWIDCLDQLFTERTQALGQPAANEWRLRTKRCVNPLIDPLTHTHTHTHTGHGKRAEHKATTMKLDYIS